MKLKEKEVQKEYSKPKICLERTYRLKVSANSRLKPIYIIGQRKAFYGQKIPEPSCERKETVDTDMLEW